MTPRQSFQYLTSHVISSLRIPSIENQNVQFMYGPFNVLIHSMKVQVSSTVLIHHRSCSSPYGPSFYAVMGAPLARETFEGKSWSPCVV